MDNRKGDEYYLGEVIENINVILSYAKDKNYADFIQDGELIDAIMFRLIQMAESIKKISAKYKAEHGNVPWGLILGFRNGIVHEYGKTDYNIVYEIVSKDIRELKNQLLKDPILSR